MQLGNWQLAIGIGKQRDEQMIILSKIETA